MTDQEWKNIKSKLTEEDLDRLAVFWDFIISVRKRRASMPPEKQVIPKPYPTKHTPVEIGSEEWRKSAK